MNTFPVAFGRILLGFMVVVLLFEANILLETSLGQTSISGNPQD